MYHSLSEEVISGLHCISLMEHCCIGFFRKNADIKSYEAHFILSEPRNEPWASPNNSSVLGISCLSSRPVFALSFFAKRVRVLCGQRPLTLSAEEEVEGPVSSIIFDIRLELWFLDIFEKHLSLEFAVLMLKRFAQMAQLILRNFSRFSALHPPSQFANGSGIIFASTQP